LVVLALFCFGEFDQASAANPIPAPEFLSAGEVERILRQAVAEAEARAAPATIAVTDRVGNVLAVYQMTGAEDDLISVDAGRPIVDPGGLAGPAFNELLADNDLSIATAAAIAKAITGAYLSSGGNAFSTRTASQIVQENFNPGSTGLEGGPLFGVQISQLPCSDLSVRFETSPGAGGTVDPRIGPKRSPLGFSADPGGLPLYQNGTLVGGIGVIADGVYGLDRDIRDRDRDLDELIAVAGSIGFAAPRDLRAERVAVDGRSLRLADGGDLRTSPSDADAVSLAVAGAFPDVIGYFNNGAPLAGTAFGFGRSGIRPDPDDLFDNDRAFVLATAGGVNRFPPQAGSEGAVALSAAEVTTLLTEALGVALAARGQIRRPLGSHAEVTISVVDTTGQILGIVRTPDAPVFGTDVSLQKARSSMFFSNPAAAADLRSVAPAPIPVRAAFRRPRGYVRDFRAFLGPNALSGEIAYGNRSIGNTARPFFPDGNNGNVNGPLSAPFERWSPFGTGLQVDLVAGNLAQHLFFVLGLDPNDTEAQCAGLSRLANGLQIFSGGVPIYRDDDVLVGGIGVSGDGIDQDDMIAFLGLDRAGRALGTIGNAPRGMRADRLNPLGVHLRYVQCPFAPFLGSDRQNVCQGR
jgi:uncharacterized protein GlcG (DUF336 family)